MAITTEKKKSSDRHRPGKHVTLRLPDRESALLRDLAQRNDRTCTAEILRALRRHLQAEGVLPTAE